MMRNQNSRGKHQGFAVAKDNASCPHEIGDGWEFGKLGQTWVDAGKGLIVKCVKSYPQKSESVEMPCPESRHHNFNHPNGVDLTTIQKFLNETSHPNDKVP